MSRFHVVVPTAFLEKIDRYAASQYMSRSTLVRVALLQKMGLNNMLGLKPVKEDKKESDPDGEFIEFMRKLYGDDGMPQWLVK